MPPPAPKVGPVLDNFSLSIDAVPEASTWVVMVAGFGLVCGAVRGRRQTAVDA